MILIYAKPEDEEIYAEEGGEDWGWFVNDVSEYFTNNHPQVLFANVYHDGLTDKEIKQIEDELQPEGFGYVFIDGNKKGWAGHDMPGSVIRSAEEFFGLEPAEN
ncbi:hypothetical protein CRYO30217_03420 [Parvicella tangerina]|uniref:Uncharacterized protein n=2 Tax=Parvicella tangerina TaxID=2829795 RepID=A0A916JQG8_9FLAO|nr:hypothetical protein CRYO30217_03420 [Parvicella tangerina]